MPSTITITGDQFRAAVSAAVRAPSMYNAQPWRFAMRDDAIDVRIDPHRLLPVADPEHWAAHIACGAAIANMRLALAAAGYQTSLRLWPAESDALWVARLSITGRYQMSPRERALWSAVPVRYSNRRPFFESAVPATAVAQLTGAAEQSGGWLVVASDRQVHARIAEIVRSADERLRTDAGYLAELAEWTGRHSVEPAGIPPESAGVAPAGHDLLAMRDFGGRERAQGRDFESDPLLMVLGWAGSTRRDTVHAGIALQMVLLTATDERLATSMLSQPIEVPDAREDLRQAVQRNGVPHMVIRVGFGQPGSPTERRPVDTVIDAVEAPDHPAP
jgi:hypothetical protein